MKSNLIIILLLIGFNKCYVILFFLNHSTKIILEKKILIIHFYFLPLLSLQFFDFALLKFNLFLIVFQTTLF